jgi:hypothetical protein
MTCHAALRTAASAAPFAWAGGTDVPEIRVAIDLSPFRIGGTLWQRMAAGLKFVFARPATYPTIGQPLVQRG